MRGPTVLLVLVAVLAGCAAPGAGPAPDEAPDWSFTDTEGATHSRDAPPANATVLFFMATWCSSCRATAPVLASVQDDHAARGVRFYSIGFDPEEPAEKLREWKARHAQDWPHGHDPSLAMQRAFGVTSQSSVILLDAEGRVVERWGYGRVTEPALRSALDALLGA